MRQKKENVEKIALQRDMFMEKSLCITESKIAQIET